MPWCSFGNGSVLSGYLQEVEEGQDAIKMRLLIPIYLIHHLLFGLSNPALGALFGELDHEDSNSDSVIVEAAPEVEDQIELRSKRQFVGVSQFGQYPGFPVGWPFGIRAPQLPQLPQPPKPISGPVPVPTTTSPIQIPPTPAAGAGSCKTSRGVEGYCATLRQCYPVLYNSEADQENLDTSRNPGLTELLRSVSGPCQSPEESTYHFYFKADAEIRRRLICCSNEKPKLPEPAPPVTTTTGSPVPPNSRPRPPFGIGGQRPPTASPGKRTTTETPQQPIVGSSCGISKIVGGVETSPGKYPWVVALMNGQRQFCGGSLIDNYHILTAAHCIAHMGAHDVARIRVLLGAHNIYQITPGTVVKKVQRLVRHKFFSHRTLHNDVAILKLDSAVKFTNNIIPICLARGQNRFANEQAVVAGWGGVSEHGGQPAALREVTIDVWPNSKCKSKYGHLAPGGITDHMVCAGTENRGDACRGDSGGPLMSNTGSYYEQIGIVSWGIGCGRFPGVYSRVTDFLDWITKNIQ